jgi:NAD(P)H-nitrite reductase large subunit
MKLSLRYVIIGNSFAGIFAVEAIRKIDPSGEIVVISDESEHAYSRAMLHEWLGGMVSLDKVRLRGPEFYDRLRVIPMLGERVTGIEVEQRSVVLDSGEKVGFDRLLIASGGVPFIPPGIGGIDDFDGVFTFTKMSDAEAIKKVITKAQQGVVLGGGLIGLQCAEALAHLGVRVTVVELADGVLPMALDTIAGEIVEREVRQEGIEVLTGETIECIYGTERRIEGVTLKGGGDIPCQFVVVAIGVRPNVGFLRCTGIGLDRGVIVDDRMATNVEGIYAAGDCAQAPEILTGRQMTIPVIPIASTHGMTAGHNMAGEERRFRGSLSLNAMQFGRVPIVSYGFIRDEEGAEVLKEDRDGVYKKVIIKENRITGAVFVRAIDRAGIFRHLIEEKVDVSGFKEKLLRPDFGIAHLPREERDRLFTRPPHP